MDIGGNNSYEGYPTEVSWNPSTPAKTGFPVNCENSPQDWFNVTTFGCREGNLGIKGQVFDINGEVYNNILMDNVEMWNSIPCKDLLALADAATTTKVGNCGGNGDGNEVNMEFGSRDRPFDSNSHSGGRSVADTYGRPNRSTYLFDLNSPPITLTEPHLTTSLSSQLTPVTPDQTKTIEHKQVVSDIVNSNKDGKTDQAANKQDNERFDIDEQPQLIIEQLEVYADLKNGSSNEITLNKTPQPKERRRKHRPKVVIEGQTKKSTPKRDGSSTEKRKYVRKIETEKPKATDTTVRETRYSCRREINFDQDQLQNPITPNKTELTHDKKTFSTAKSGNKSKRKHLNNENAMGIQSLEAYLSMFTNYNGNNSVLGLHFPAIYKKKRSKKCQNSVNNWSVLGRRYVFKAREMATVCGEKDDLKTYTQMLPFGEVENFRKKRTKGLKRVRDLASFVGMIEGFHQGLRWKSLYDIDALINQFERLDIESRMVEKNKHTIIPYVTRYQEKNALVLYQRDGSIVPFEDSYNQVRRRKPRPKVNLDDETSRVWRLLLEDINNQGIDGTDEDKAKWWEEERNVFRGRAASFIARMHLVQGDRRFSQWKGSVVDSVIGVFLTQNVSDHLSSSAFMSLAARYPLKSKSSNEQLQEDSCQLDLDKTIIWHEGKSNQQPDQGHGSMTLHDADLVSSQNSVDTSPNSIQSSVTHTAERSGSCSLSNSIAELTDASKPTILGGSASFTSTMLQEAYSQDQANEPSNKIGQDKLHGMGNSHEVGIISKDCELQTVCGSGEEGTIMHEKREENFASEHSGITAESATRNFPEASKSCNTLQADLQKNSKIDINQHAHENNCEVKEVLDIENFLAEISEVTESNNIVENSRLTANKIVESNSDEHVNLQTSVSGVDKGSSKAKREKTGKARKIKADWDGLRVSAQVNRKRERTPNTMDSLDYEAVRCADVNEIADTIKERGMNNMLAERIKEFLNRLVKDHGSIDLEWLRDVPPDKAKEYLLSFRGLGLKSVECVRLLTLHHLAFPVDTNVGRIAVRLGWVPLQPLPESLQLHLLELYPVLESIQKYLWPRLCKLDQRTLYELHYQMITFGKVFCTKNKPNCNACPVRGECRHFASAFASARLALPAPEEKSIVSAIENKRPSQSQSQSPTGITNHHPLTLPPPNRHQHQQFEVQNHEPVIEEPATPEPIVEVPATPEPEKTQQEFDIEDFCEDSEEIPTIKLNIEEFTQNLQTYMENNMELADGDMSKALVALTSEAASIPTPKLKNVSQLRTEHQVYELPDSHPLLEGLDEREPDDPCTYLLAIWTPGETAETIQPPEGQCSSQESGTLCQEETCFLCNSIREANSQTVRGTLLIPCRTAMRGSFPLNGTYFQVNEVFADHDSSLNPIDVPRSWLWNLPRRTVYFGTSIPTIFKGLTTEGIQYCFWRGFVCVRGFDQKTRAPRPLMARLHFPASKLKRSRGRTDEG